MRERLNRLFCFFWGHSWSTFSTRLNVPQATWQLTRSCDLCETEEKWEEIKWIRIKN